MRTLPILLCLLGVLCPDRATATGDSLYFLLPTDTVVLYRDAPSGHLLFDHRLSPGQSLFGAARFYGLTLDEIYHLNPTLRPGYETGDAVSVVIPPSLIRSGYHPDSVAWFVPLKYRMRKGETLYGLTKRELPHLDGGVLERLNPGLDPANLRVGQVLNVGYFMITGVPEGAQAEVEDPYVVRNRGMAQLWETRSRGKKLRSANGKAAWTSKGDRNKWMVLHRTAPLGSLVEIDEPRSRKVLYARVVGRIPAAMDSDVILVVSPLLVRAFGVRDRRFYVRTRFF